MPQISRMDGDEPLRVRVPTPGRGEFRLRRRPGLVASVEKSVCVSGFGWIGGVMLPRTRNEYGSRVRTGAQSLRNV